MVLASIAVTAIGVVCRFDVRRSAVTVISWSPGLCCRAAVCACTASGTTLQLGQPCVTKSSLPARAARAQVNLARHTSPSEIMNHFRRPDSPDLRGVP